MAKEPRGPLARYAFGYTDEKPSLLFWLILGAMTLFVIGQMFSISWPPL